MRWHHVTYWERLEEGQKWRRWFAWFPVTVNGNQRVWLEVVERRYGEFLTDGYLYRTVDRVA